MVNIETKILDILVHNVVAKLEVLGAKKVFDAVRVITYFKRDDEVDEPFLKLTEEGDKLKLSAQRHKTHEEIKLFVSRKEECLQLLAVLGYLAVAEVKARRISYELGTTDFDIDEFPGVSAFLEVDLGDHPSLSFDEIVKRLGVSHHTMGQMSTPDIVRFYGKDYFALYAISKT